MQGVQQAEDFVKLLHHVQISVSLSFVIECSHFNTMKV